MESWILSHTSRSIRPGRPTRRRSVAGSRRASPRRLGRPRRRDDGRRAAGRDRDDEPGCLRAGHPAASTRGGTRRAGRRRLFPPFRQQIPPPGASPRRRPGRARASRREPHRVGNGDHLAVPARPRTASAPARGSVRFFSPRSRLHERSAGRRERTSVPFDRRSSSASPSAAVPRRASSPPPGSGEAPPATPRRGPRAADPWRRSRPRHRTAPLRLPPRS